MIAGLSSGYDVMEIVVQIFTLRFLGGWKSRMTESLL